MPAPTSADESLLIGSNTGATEKGNKMFSTDSFIAAEVAYRRQKVTKDWGSIRRTRGGERKSVTPTER